MAVKVKICGLTNLPDALAAAEAGADALGFVFYSRSPRFVALATVTGIIRQLPESLLKFGVFVNEPAEHVRQAIAQCGLNGLQFHGDESPEYCLQFGLTTLKAFRLRDASSLAGLERFQTDGWLLDAYSPALHGGTGETFDWNLAREARKLGRPIFLAGGLTPDNVAAAVREVQPEGVDVSSGVESLPGRKDHSRIRDFVAAARSAAS